jgi:membrane-bound serine protease (ClpP class)
VALLGAILLAIFVVPAPWGVPLIAAGAAVEVAEAWAMLRWSRRRRARSGAEAMIGAEAVVIADGWVRIAGERWRARSVAPLEDAPLEPGATVEVLAIEGLTLVVRS